MESTKVKMCIACNRLLDVDVLQCPCGGTEFTEVILDLEEGVEEVPTYDSIEEYWEYWNEQGGK